MQILHVEYVQHIPYVGYDKEVACQDFKNIGRYSHKVLG